ncbi:MAG: PilZ domain-containing protein [Pseudomonadota bacterium]
MSSEQRVSQRRPLKVKAMLAMEGAAPMTARTVDIGTSGVCLTVDSPLQVGQVGQVGFELYFDGKATVVNARAKVAYCIFSGGEFKIGLSFVNLGIDAVSTIAKYLR